MADFGRLESPHHGLSRRSFQRIRLFVMTIMFIDTVDSSDKIIRTIDVGPIGTVGHARLSLIVLGNHIDGAIPT